MLVVHLVMSPSKRIDRIVLLFCDIIYVYGAHEVRSGHIDAHQEINDRSVDVNKLKWM